MQAQATGSRRFGFNRITLLALAIGLLAITAAVAISTLDRGADDQPAVNAVEGQVDPAIRDTFPSAGEGRLEMRFWEQNVQLPDGVLVEPAQSVERLHFLEWNTWGEISRDQAQPVDDYLYLEERDRVTPTPTPVGIHRGEQLYE